MQLRGAAAHLRRQSNRVFSPFALTTDQFVLLTVLRREGESSQEELARRCYSDTATVGAMVALLEEKRLVTRSPQPGDGRAWNVMLTSSGLALAEQMWRSSSPLRESLAKLFEEPELRRLVDALKRLAGAMRPPGRKGISPRTPGRKQRPASAKTTRAASSRGSPSNC